MAHATFCSLHRSHAARQLAVHGSVTPFTSLNAAMEKQRPGWRRSPGAPVPRVRLDVRHGALAAGRSPPEPAPTSERLGMQRLAGHHMALNVQLEVAARGPGRCTATRTVTSQLAEAQQPTALARGFQMTDA